MASAAIETEIDVTVPRDFHRRDAGDFADGIDKIGSDFLRRLFERAGELERDRDGELTERGLLWLFERDFRVDAEADVQGFAEGGQARRDR